MRRVPLACLLVLLAGDEPVGSLVKRLHDDSEDEKSWMALAHHEEPGEALRAVRELLRKDPGSPTGWHALWQLADRVGDFPLGAEASQRALDLLAEAGLLESVDRAEDALRQDYFHRGLAHAERQTLLRGRAIRLRLGLETKKIDDRIERIDIEVRRRAHPNPEGLRAEAEAARARGDWRAEHGLLVDLAYHDWATAAFREGYEAFRRVLEIHGPHSREQRANDQNGAARLALELALTCTGSERDELLEQALAHAETALEEHEVNDVGGPADRVRDHCVLAHIRAALGREDEALAHYERELALVLELRKSIAIEGDQALRIFHSVQDHIFEDFAIFLARGGKERPPDVQKALRVSEVGRVGGLKELYRLRGLPSPSWTEQELPLSEIQRRAGSGKAAVLVFWAGSREAALACITEREIRVFPLAPPEVLDRAAESFARVAFDLAAKDAVIEHEGRRAFDLFLAPAQAAFDGARRLVIVGAGRWGRLPFAALVSAGKAPLRERYLAARFEIAFAPTLGALTAERPAAGKGLPGAFGFDGTGSFAPELRAHFGLQSLPALRRAEAESRAVATKLGGQAWLGNEATEEAFRRVAAEASLLHFAGHALIDDEDGTRSALLLSPSSERPSSQDGDGFLTLGEILELRIAARLVILSACRTARGESYAGEGVGGVARCLLAAGAQSLLLSLALVDDAKAPIFVEHVVEALAAGSHPAVALVSAQRRMLGTRVNAHPAFWASFVLHGQEDLLR